MDLIYADCSGSVPRSIMQRMFALANERQALFAAFDTKMRTLPAPPTDFDNQTSAGGGTDINNALLTLDAAYDVSRLDTIFVLSDLYCTPPNRSIKHLLEKTNVIYVSIAADSLATRDEIAKQEQQQLEDLKGQLEKTPDLRSRVAGLMTFSTLTAL